MTKRQGVLLQGRQLGLKAAALLKLLQLNRHWCGPAVCELACLLHAALNLPPHALLRLLPSHAIQSRVGQQRKQAQRPHRLAHT